MVILAAFVFIHTHTFELHSAHSAQVFLPDDYYHKIIFWHTFTCHIFCANTLLVFCSRQSWNEIFLLRFELTIHANIFLCVSGPDPGVWHFYSNECQSHWSIFIPKTIWSVYSATVFSIRKSFGRLTQDTQL